MIAASAGIGRCRLTSAAYQALPRPGKASRRSGRSSDTRRRLSVVAGMTTIPDACSSSRRARNLATSGSAAVTVHQTWITARSPRRVRIVSSGEIAAVHPPHTADSATNSWNRSRSSGRSSPRSPMRSPTVSATAHHVSRATLPPRPSSMRLTTDGSTPAWRPTDRCERFDRMRAARTPRPRAMI